MRQSIRNSVFLALLIINLELVARELPDLADLSRAQTLCIHEPAEIVMVGEYKYLILGPFYVVFPGLEGLNNG